MNACLPGPPAADEWLRGEYDTKQQAELCNKVAVDLGFSLEHGRLDVSVHPFTGGEGATHKCPLSRQPVDATEGASHHVPRMTAARRHAFVPQHPRVAASSPHSPMLSPLPPRCDRCRAGTHPTDVRMTTRFKKDDLTEGITGGHPGPAARAACIFPWHRRRGGRCRQRPKEAVG